MAAFENTAGAESLVGTDLSDVFAILVGAGAGNDRFTGKGGNDEASGGTGNDTLNGDDGDDRLFGGDQKDQLFGGNGHDRLYGGQDDDTIVGAVGDDLLDSGSGNDDLFDSDGDNKLFGGSGDDILLAYDTERLSTNELYGGSGDDVFTTRGGNDILQGGRGIDRLIFAGFTGFEGPAGITLNLAKRVDVVDLGTKGTLRISGFENIYTGSGDDVIAGNSADNSVQTNDGEDRLLGKAGNDRLDGGLGDDVLFGGAGDDALEAFQGSDQLEGGDGADTFRFAFVLSEFPSQTQNHQIRDFKPGTDKIDMTGFSDATFDVAPSFRDCHFSFIGSADFSGDADEVRFEGGWVYADLNQDGASDFSFRVNGIESLSASDFLFD